MSDGASRAERDAEAKVRLKAALAKDAGALDELVEIMAPVVHVRVARAMARRRHEARGRNPRADLEDLVQEVFAALFADDAKALRAWAPERGLTFENFVGLLAEREVASILRSGRRNPWTEDPTLDTTLHSLGPPVAGPEARVASRQTLALLTQRLQERLSPLGRHYFELLFVQQRTVAEVAAETEASPDALYAWRSRLGRLLKQLMAELDAEEKGTAR